MTKKRFHSILFLLFVFLAPRAGAQVIPLKQEYAKTLLALCDALLERQLTDTTHGHYGAIACAHCNVLHTRAAEAVYPFSVAWTITKNKRYLKAASDAADWLIKQQEENGSWKETPEEWTGTTTDQLLMLLLSYEIIAPAMHPFESNTWMRSMKKAADYLLAVMTPEFASINYVATTTATLAKATQVTGNPVYLQKATTLAHRTISKIDEAGFLNGEGGRSHRNKMGVDLGYNMEMSLWGLGLYAKISGDTLVNEAVKKSLQQHLYFIYPDGSLDGSWGIRSNKWTMYGSATSDGCQALFSMFANEDKRYATASYRNLQFLRKNIMSSGLIGYGPQHAAIFTTPPCIYPTFTKAKNLALAYTLETKPQRVLTPLPTEKTGWYKYHPTLDVVQVRTKNFMATVTGYRYKDIAAGAKSKYMYRPNGGAVSYLWVQDHGALQASSPTVYSRPEPMSFPEAPGVQSLTPRIEYKDSLGYFTNLFDFDSRLIATQKKAGEFFVETGGELKDKNWLSGGVGYKMDYLFTDQYLEKTIQLTWHDAWPVVQIIEPFIQVKGMTIVQTDPRTVIMKTGKKTFRFRILLGNAQLTTGEDAVHYWAPYPALKAFPLRLELRPVAGSFQQTVKYRIEVM